MPVSLSLENDSGRETFVTHALREGLMIGTVVIHLIAELREGDTILTLLVWLMLAFALGLDFREEVLKAFVFNKLIIGISSNAIGALLMRRMMA